MPLPQNNAYTDLLREKMLEAADKQLTKGAKETAENMPPEALAKMLQSSGVRQQTQVASQQKPKQTKVQRPQQPQGIDILQQLMQGLASGQVSQEQVFGAINELAQTPVERPGTAKGIIDAFKSGGGFGQPYTQPMGLSDATTMIKKLLETSTIVGKEQREQQKFPMEIQQMKQSLVQGDIKTAADMIELAEKIGNIPLKEKLQEEVSRLYGSPMSAQDLRQMNEEQAISKAKLAGKIEGIKEMEKGKVKDLSSAQKNATSTFRMLQQFGRSLKELREFDPEIDQVGYGGWIKRRGAQLATALDQLPETKALQISILPLANKMARDIEGGRVTDQDREVYANSMADAIKNPGVTNIRLSANALTGMIDLGGNVIPHLKQLAASGVDIFDDIINQVLIEYPELVEDIYGKGAKIVSD